jgi:hypothetical protein
MAGREMPGERRFVDDAAARRLNEDRTRFHGCKLGITDHAAGRRDQRHVQRHHVGGGQQLPGATSIGHPSACACARSRSAGS